MNQKSMIILYMVNIIVKLNQNCVNENWFKRSNINISVNTLLSKKGNEKAIDADLFIKIFFNYGCKSKISKYVPVKSGSDIEVKICALILNLSDNIEEKQMKKKNY